jgi:hypothetical protein
MLVNPSLHDINGELWAIQLKSLRMKVQGCWWNWNGMDAYPGIIN